MNNTNLLIEQYCNTRINDIHQFVNINDSKSKSNINKNAAARSMFYEKRFELKRTTSHKRRIIPRMLKLKRKAEEEARPKNDDINKRRKLRNNASIRCRKHRRRFHILVRQHAICLNQHLPPRSKSVVKWLPSHRWNCTRFHMEKCWNMQIPMCSNERSRRIELLHLSRNKLQECNDHTKLATVDALNDDPKIILKNNKMKLVMSNCLDKHLFQCQLSSRRIVCEPSRKLNHNKLLSTNNDNNSSQLEFKTNRCVILDQSFMQTLEIQAIEQDTLLEIISHFVDNFVDNELHPEHSQHAALLRGELECECQFYQLDLQPKGFLSPGWVYFPVSNPETDEGREPDVSHKLWSSCSITAHARVINALQNDLQSIIEKINDASADKNADSESVHGICRLNMNHTSLARFSIRGGDACCNQLLKRFLDSHDSINTGGNPEEAAANTTLLHNLLQCNGINKIWKANHVLPLALTTSDRRVPPTHVSGKELSKKNDQGAIFKAKGKCIHWDVPSMNRYSPVFSNNMSDPKNKTVDQNTCPQSKSIYKSAGEYKLLGTYANSISGNSYANKATREQWGAHKQDIRQSKIQSSLLEEGYGSCTSALKIYMVVIRKEMNNAKNISKRQKSVNYNGYDIVLSAVPPVLGSTHANRNSNNADNANMNTVDAAYVYNLLIQCNCTPIGLLEYQDMELECGWVRYPLDHGDLEFHCHSMLAEKRNQQTVKDLDVGDDADKSMEKSNCSCDACLWKNDLQGKKSRNPLSTKSNGAVGKEAHSSGTHTHMSGGVKWIELMKQSIAWDQSIDSDQDKNSQITPNAHVEMQGIEEFVVMRNPIYVEQYLDMARQQAFQDLNEADSDISRSINYNSMTHKLFTLPKMLTPTLITVRLVQTRKKLSLDQSNLVSSSHNFHANGIYIVGPLAIDDHSLDIDSERRPMYCIGYCTSIKRCYNHTNRNDNTLIAIGSCIADLLLKYTYICHIISTAHSGDVARGPVKHVLHVHLHTDTYIPMEYEVVY